MDEKRLSNGTPNPTGARNGPDAESEVRVDWRLVVATPVPWSGPPPQEIEHPGAESDPLWRLEFKQGLLIDGDDTGPDGKSLEDEAPLQWTCVGAPTAAAARERFLMDMQQHWASQGIGSPHRWRDLESPAEAEEQDDYEDEEELAETLFHRLPYYAEEVEHSARAIWERLETQPDAAAREYLGQLAARVDEAIHVLAEDIFETLPWWKWRLGIEKPPRASSEPDEPAEGAETERDDE